MNVTPNVKAMMQAARFSVGDHVRSTDLLTKGEVVQIDADYPNGPLYLVKYQLWAGEPKRTVWKAEDDLLGGEEAERYWTLWMADRAVAQQFMLGVMRNRGRERARADYQRGLRAAEEAA